MSAQWPAYFKANVVREGFGSSRLSSYAIALEAWRRDLRVTFLNPNMSRFRIDDGLTDLTFNYACPVSVTTEEARNSLRDKWTTKEMLGQAGVPVPKGDVLLTRDTTTENLREVASDIGFPVTIKPLSGSKGQGVFSGIGSWAELERTYTHLVESQDVPEVLIEENILGDDYRLLVLGDQVLAACKRIPANVVGDGENSIENLIANKNALRKRNPFLSRGLIRPDYEVQELLRKQQYRLDSVPEQGQYVRLRRIANASAGGDVVDVSDTIPDEIKRAAVSAVAAVPGISIAGVDFLYDPDSKDETPSYAVIEMNYRPHIGVNMYPTHGQGQDVPGKIIDHFFPGSSRHPGRGEETLTFNWSKARKGFANTETQALPPAPTHRCVFRRQVIFAASPGGVSSQEAAEVEDACRHLDVSGYIALGNSSHKMIVGGVEANVGEAIRTVSAITRSETTRVSRWNGRMLTSFDVRNHTSQDDDNGRSTQPEQRDGEIRVSMVGDVLLHGNLLELGKKSGDYTYSKQLGGAADLIQGSDCASVNLENIAAGEKYGLSGFPKFNAPEEILDGLKDNGFQVMSVANNHMLDKGEEGLSDSLNHIRSRGLHVTGAGERADKRASEAVIDIAGTRVGFVSFTDGAKLRVERAGQTHINYFAGEDSGTKMFHRVSPIKKKVNALRRYADVLVLQLHFGEEYHRQPSSFQKEFIASLAELGIDAIVGHHPHVLQPIEWIQNSRGKDILVAYSLGNYFSGQAGVHRQIGGVLTFGVEPKNYPGNRIFGIVRPVMNLTYVDHNKAYEVRRMSDVVRETPDVKGPSGTVINLKKIYEKHLVSLNGGDPRVEIK
ncbi:MAG: CapA family protein [Nesterenkonia sp.]